ncbi:TetR/AcrR family transcriptional regulator [Agrobacterium tumefaciens]|jgi:AcrR family transcriptional regulator|uniref:TetR/AcrR family transcriptional regulator n=1 Tax=Agrobacterium tumefaciens TaxID=358 RepID=UPI00080FF76E|nr:TetR/AcrR family transcriptional regulator [Agrobacterium tumefaciens]NTD10115.1 TetR/AcrR family transcriptional regulator [Agrobacterium tumefaciens]OCJ63504.1 TetR family transcriptional regulator [Agrobacterium tumefaciens]
MAKAKLTRAEQKIQRPLEILDAAFEEFTKRGFTATRVEDIAERVGVTKGTVYVYFETKEALFEAMIRHASSPFQEAFKAYARTSDDPVEELRMLLEFLFDALVDNRKMRELFRFIVAEGAKFPDLIDQHHDVVMAPVFERINTILEDGVAKKRFRANPTELAKVVMSPIVGTLVFRLIFDDRRSLDKQVVLKIHLELIMRGLLA